MTGDDPTLVGIAMIRAGLADDIDEELYLWNGATDQTMVAMSLAGMALAGIRLAAEATDMSPTEVLDSLIQSRLRRTEEE